MKSKDVQGVYLLLNKTKSKEDTLFIKIGCSKHIYQRIKEIKKALAFTGDKSELEMFTIISCNNYKLLEKHLHILCKKYQYKNEWFIVDENSLNDILLKIDVSYYNK